jgi:hypothetical protein
MKILNVKNMLAAAMILVAANARADGSVVPVDTKNWTQISDLPTVFINIRGGIDITKKTDTYYRARIVIVDKSKSMLTMDDSVGIRGRGNSTWNSAKKPYRLKFDKKKQLLGASFAKNKSWTLLANAADKTMIRNALTYDLGKFAGMPFCPAAKFVDLVLNGQYRGTYQISDQVNVDASRVDIDEDNGWFLEMASWNAAEAPYVQVNGGGCFNIKNPEYDTSTTAGAASTEALKTEVLAFCQNEKDAVLGYSVAYTSPTKGWRAYLDESSLINYLVTTEMIGNVDAYTSIYLYKDKDQTKLSFGPLWDEDLGYNNCPTSGDFLALTGWRLEDAMGRPVDEIFRAFHEETCEPLENPLTQSCAACGRSSPCADAADPQGRQRAVRGEHRGADPRWRRPGLGRRARVPRRQREPRAESPPVVPREPRPADGPREPA